MRKDIFVTGTDTGVGKTVVSFVLGVLLQDQGIDIGVMKPVQCAGDDSKFLIKGLQISDDEKDINPYYTDEAFSPHIAFERKGKEIVISKILDSYHKLSQLHQILVIEGSGGLMVPFKKDYYVSDLIQELDTDIIIVARLGLGTINHTLLTIDQARRLGINVHGVIFTQSHVGTADVPEITNPKTIETFGDVKILGIVPFLETVDRATVLKECKGCIDLSFISSGKTNTEELIEWDKEYVWHPFTQMKDWQEDKPLVIDKARGSYLIDTEGKRYIDGVSSLWVNVHGHRNTVIDRALHKQIDTLSHSTMLGLGNKPAIQLAKELVGLTPEGLDKVFYSDNGSTAVEIAIKMAYQYWQNVGKTNKVKILHLENSYHGDTLGSVSVGGIDLFHKVYKDLIVETIQVDFPDCYRCPKGETYPEYAFKYLEKLENIMREENSSIACFIVEPIVQGAAGMIIWPEGILKEMEKMCCQYDILFICDEVATGFGRTGKMFACEHENVVPDIMCLAKGITGGYLPLAATMVSQRIYEGFLYDYKDVKTFFHGHTYTGNPLACRAALANLAVFREEDVLSKPF